MNISINEPCHENWDAMTPNQQGAFCHSCKKDVVDFSKMSVEKIKEFFSKPQDGRVCGRFEEKQLQELSFDDFFARFRYWNFGRKFAIIFFLAFGFWIFSNSALAQSEKYLKGDVAYIPPKTEKKDSTKKHPGTSPVKQEEFLRGKTIKTNTVTPLEKQEQRVIMGKVKCVRPETTEKEPKKEETPVKKPETTTPVKTNKEENLVMGMVIARPVEPVKPILIEPKTTTGNKLIIKPTGEERSLNPEENKNTEADPVVIYPNPSNGNFTIDTKGKKTLHILDSNGRLVMTQEINGSTLINAQHLQPGTYSISLLGEGKPLIKKIIITH